MELSDIKILIDRYYDGETMLDEERALAEYLASCTELDDEMRAVSMMLGVFAQEREVKAPEGLNFVKPAKSLRMIATLKRYIAAVSAACVVAVVALGVFVSHDNEVVDDFNLVCYVDGKIVKDEQLALAESERIVGEVFESVDAAFGCISRITHCASK